LGIGYWVLGIWYWLRASGRWRLVSGSAISKKPVAGDRIEYPESS